VGKSQNFELTYWIGPVFEFYAGHDSTRWPRNWGEMPRYNLQGSAPSGHAAVASGGTVETDQIILSPAHLRALYHKQICFVVWCLLGYGSRLQSDKWFEEIAIYLECVLNRDPDTFNLTEKVTEGGRPTGGNSVTFLASR
jgi:hypothetical protein